LLSYADIRAPTNDQPRYASTQLWLYVDPDDYKFDPSVIDFLDPPPVG
jgi:hypothetical protein